MYSYIPATTVFFLFFFFFLGNKFEFSSYVQNNWVWDKFAENGMAHDARFPENPFKFLNGYLWNNRFFSFASRKSQVLQQGFSYDYPLVGKGFLEYQKVGKNVSYFSSDRELLWQKEFKSYPRSGFDGELILLISGDNNRVFLSDINGNLTGEKYIDGNFLSDYAFIPSNGGAALLFSSGEIVRLDSKGKKIYIVEPSQSTEFIFFKSIGVSHNGQFLAVHFQKSEADYISIFDFSGKIIYTKKNSSVYPHKIFLSVGQYGNTLVNAQDKIEILDKSGKTIFLKKKKKAPIYQLSFHTGRFFTATDENEIFFLDESGKIIKKVKNISLPVRAIPSSNSKEVFLETKNEIFHYRIFD